MATVYEWKCKRVEVYPTHTDQQDPANTEEQVVFKVYLQIKATKDENIKTVSFTNGTQTLSTANLAAFTNFDDLTNDDVITWAKNAMGADEVAAIEADLDTKVAAMENPTSMMRVIGSPLEAE